MVYDPTFLLIFMVYVDHRYHDPLQKKGNFTPTLPSIHSTSAPFPAAQFPQLSCHHLHRHLVLEAEVKFLRVLQLEFPESPPKCPAQIGVRHMVLQSVFDGNVDGHTVLGVYELI